MSEIDSQERGWRDWFAQNAIVPLAINYEDLLQHEGEAVASVMRLLDVTADSADRVGLPRPDRQGDAVNQEWIDRFRARPAWPGETADRFVPS